MKNKKVRLSLLPDPFSSDEEGERGERERESEDEEDDNDAGFNDDDFNNPTEGGDKRKKKKSTKNTSNSNKKNTKTTKKRKTENKGKGVVHSVYGSGYPGDPNTKKWLVNNFDPVFGYSELVRFSWKTSKVSIEEKGVMVDWGDEEEDEAEKLQKQQQRSMSAFLSSSLASSSAKKRHIDVKKRYKYFHELNTNVTTCF
jgi:hypothetical protein